MDGQRRPGLSTAEGGGLLKLGDAPFLQQFKCVRTLENSEELLLGFASASLFLSSIVLGRNAFQ